MDPIVGVVHPNPHHPHPHHPHPHPHSNPNPVHPHPITPPTTTTSLFEAPLRPLAGHPLQTQHKVLVPPIRKAADPLNMAGFIAPTAAFIRTPTGNKETLRLADCKRSTLLSPLRSIVLPLIYNFPWRCRTWFFAIDQDGDGALSSEELRTHSI